MWGRLRNFAHPRSEHTTGDRDKESLPHSPMWRNGQIGRITVRGKRAQCS
jgi:hypothetical protein